MSSLFHRRAAAAIALTLSAAAQAGPTFHFSFQDHLNSSLLVEGLVTLEDTGFGYYEATSLHVTASPGHPTGFSVNYATADVSMNGFVLIGNDVDLDSSWFTSYDPVSDTTLGLNEDSGRSGYSYFVSDGAWQVVDTRATTLTFTPVSTASAVPEPSLAALFALGVAVAGSARRRSSRTAERVA